VRAANAPEAPGPEWDARFVKMTVPKRLLTDQVFPVAITMKNTGSQTWREGRDIRPTTLRSQDPEGNTTWGTSYIIQGQGTSVAPGQEFTYRSNLKAPSRPGEYAFQWRDSGPAGLFGEPTAKETIVVEKRQEETPVAPPALPPPDDKGRRALAFDDFEYLGSFKLPAKVGQGGGGYSESGLALRKPKDGPRRLFLNYTHPGQTLFEIEVPALAKFEDRNAAPLKVAEVKKVWGQISANKVSPNGGLWWDEEKQILYWTYYHGYWTGGALPVLNASRLADDGTVAAVGSWTVPSQKWHWGGVTRLPKEFADKFTGGRTLALGFGGYYSICGPASRGPSLGVIADPDPANQGKDVDLVELLGYKDPARAPRDGDYFSANCGFWYDPPENARKGSWTFDDHCRSGLFISLPDRHAYIAFVRLGTGRQGYDYGGITSAGSAQHWYFYNPANLGAVAKGAAKPGSVAPYLMAKDSPAMGGTATGSCFDDAERKLYLLRAGCYRAGLESHPLVHAYKVK
jgi:hypothetical protein